MALILGLDLGPASIGWSIIEVVDGKSKPQRLVDIGVRVIPVDADLVNNFSKGKDCSVNADRTAKRSMRKVNYRFKLRRDMLVELFTQFGVDFSLVNKPKTPIEKWKLRADAVSTRVPLSALAEVLIHINSRRGYTASKEDLDENNKKDKGYVAEIRQRYLAVCDGGLTPGEYFYAKLTEDPNFRVKGEILPRKAYYDEVDKILKCQSTYYPDVLTDDVIEHIRDYIMFYQRPLRSCKHLVSDCEFERRKIVDNGKEIEIGPKVAHVSNPLFQVNRIWQVLNNISFSNQDEVIKPSLEQKEAMAHQLMLGNDLGVKAIKQLCGLKPTDKKWHISDNAAKGIKGNITAQVISKAMGNRGKALTSFCITEQEVIDAETGEVKGHIVSESVYDQPLYKLWHTLYSIRSVEETRNTLIKNFGISDRDILDKLCSIDFVKLGYGNMSVKAIRKILPYLMQGHVYSEACTLTGYNHSNSMTKEENEVRPLLTNLPLLPKNSLRQPVVEKILNQMINLVNSLMEKYGNFDSIHIEMARELKMGKADRETMTKEMAKNNRENDSLAKIISDEYGLYPTKSRIVKMKLWREAGQRCIYCNRPVGIGHFLKGIDSEVEHIIPKSLIFDDSYSNKACACQECNKAKGNMTAIDFMRTHSDAELADYLKRITELMESGKISKRKYRNLLTPLEEIPQDFIDRDLRETQYITKKALEILREVSRDVMATSGKITDYVRHQWGWDTILHDLDFKMYSDAGLTETIVRDGQAVERIKDWSKRMDHRHHAIDALAVACTNRSMVNQLNHLNTLSENFRAGAADSELADRRNSIKRSLLEKYVFSMTPFSRDQVCETINSIVVSIKPVTRLTTPGKVFMHKGKHKHVVQTGIVVPRGPLHQDTIYGKIKRYAKNGELEEKVVVRYPLTSITDVKQAKSIVDKHIRTLVIDRLQQSPSAKNAFAEPLYSDAACTKAIKSVRCFTGGTNLMPVKKDADGKEIGFAMPGANHHVALYVDKNGKTVGSVARFAHCVERKRHGIPAIITDVTGVWNQILASTDGRFSEEFLKQLPEDGSTYLMHMQRNEMFVLGLDDAAFSDAIVRGDMKLLSQHLYRVQKLSAKAYLFTANTVTASSPSSFKREDQRFVLVTSIGRLMELNPKKVKVTNLGEILPI